MSDDEDRRRKRRSRWGEKGEESRSKRSKWDQGSSESQAPPQPAPVPATMYQQAALQQQQAMLAQPSGIMNMMQHQQDAAVLRQAKRLYIGNIPATAKEPEVVDLFNFAMKRAHPTRYEGVGPCVSISINYEKSFGFMEFTTSEDASLGMQFDGLMLQGQPLKVRRPKDYQPTPDEVGPSGEPVISSVVPDSSDKLFIGSLPNDLAEDQLRELVGSFGQLKAFCLVKDPVTEESKGYAFALFADTATTDKAIEGLNGLKVVDKNLLVQRASKTEGDQPVEIMQHNAEETVLAAILNLQFPFHNILQFIPGNPTGAPVPPTRILVLLNIVDDEDLEQEESYNRLKDDVALECGRFGTVKNIVIPHGEFLPPDKESEELLALVLPGQDIPKFKKERRPEVPGQRKIFVEYTEADTAQKAAMALGGRRYGFHTCITTFWDEERYRKQEFHMEEPKAVLAKLAAYQREKGETPTANPDATMITPGLPPIPGLPLGVGLGFPGLFPLMPLQPQLQAAVEQKDK